MNQQQQEIAMLNRSLRIAVLLAAAGAVGLTGFEIPARAGTLPVGQTMPQGISTDNGTGFQLAATKAEKRYRKAERQKKKRWAYNRHNHGPRYRNKTTVYKYYYGGYYYSQPWWTIAPGIVIRIN